MGKIRFPLLLQLRTSMPQVAGPNPQPPMTRKPRESWAIVRVCEKGREVSADKRHPPLYPPLRQGT